MLTPEQIEDTYEELGQMFIALDASPEKGLTYIKERLTLGRAMQDRVAELRLKVNRALSAVMEQHLIAQQLYEIQSTPDNKKKVKDLEVLKHRHVMLTKMITMQSQVLSRTAMDIRLLADLTKEQIKRGEIDPNEVPGLVKDVPVGAIATTPPVAFAFPVEGLAETVGPTGPPVTGEVNGTQLFGALPEFSPTEERTSRVAELPADEYSPAGATRVPTDQHGHALAPVEIVGFDTPLPEGEPDTIKLQDTAQGVVSFDELFQGSNHATQPSTPSVL